MTQSIAVALLLLVTGVLLLQNCDRRTKPLVNPAMHPAYHQWINHGRCSTNGQMPTPRRSKVAELADTGESDISYGAGPRGVIPGVLGRSGYRRAGKENDLEAEEGGGRAEAGQADLPSADEGEKEQDGMAEKLRVLDALLNGKDEEEDEARVHSLKHSDPNDDAAEDLNVPAYVPSRVASGLPKRAATVIGVPAQRPLQSDPWKQRDPACCTPRPDPLLPTTTAGSNVVAIEIEGGDGALDSEKDDE